MTCQFNFVSQCPALIVAGRLDATTASRSGSRSSRGAIATTSRSRIGARARARAPLGAAPTARLIHRAGATAVPGTPADRAISTLDNLRQRHLKFSAESAMVSLNLRVRV